MIRFDTPAMVAHVSAWAACESPTHDASAVNRMQDMVAAALADAPVGLSRLPGVEGLGDTLVVRAGPANGLAPIVILSHVDTVHPVGTLAASLPVRIDGDRLYGPGVFDMKGGAYLALDAFRDVARRGTARRPLVYLFTPDEEIGSPTTRQLIEAEGGKAAYVLVTEPARPGGSVVTARKGVGRFDVTVIGRPAHSGSRHEDGRSAIKEAARQILDIEGMTDYARGITTNIGQIIGGTAANVIPREARFSVDLRVTTPEDGLAMAQRILALTSHDPDVSLQITGEINRPPYRKSEGISKLHDHARTIAAQLGLSLDDVPMTGGGADGNFTAALGVPTLDGLGIEGDGAHTLQEYGLVSSLAPRAELFARLLETLH